jgi:hypothetical protein
MCHIEALGAQHPDPSGVAGRCRRRHPAEDVSLLLHERQDPLGSGAVGLRRGSARNSVSAFSEARAAALLDAAMSSSSVPQGRGWDASNLAVAAVQMASARATYLTLSRFTLSGAERHRTSRRAKSNRRTSL